MRSTMIMAIAAGLQKWFTRVRSIAWGGVAMTAAGAVLLLWAVYAPPPALVGLFVKPGGSIYVSSPGVYTRERLVNDRNDQDFWLRAQLGKLDEHLVAFSAVQSRKRNASVTPQPDPDDQTAGTGQNHVLQTDGPAQDENPAVDLSFMDSFAMRSAWRDSLRHAMLENLLDDRHDLTGNSVYGLKFDTTVYPGWYTTGRAFVRISVSTDQAEFASDAIDPKPTESGLPMLVESFYDSNYSEVLFDSRSPNYLSFTLYKQWLANVKYRLNSHLAQIYDLKCPCVGAHCEAANWAEEIGRSVDTVLATNRTTVTPVKDVQSARVLLPDPWNDFLMITVDGLAGHRCGKPPQFDVAQIIDTIYLFNGKVSDNFRAIESVDADDEAYYFLPEGGDETSYKPRSRNIRSIAQVAKKKERVVDFCMDEDGERQCSRHMSIPTGYFNFVQHVIRSDSYVYSLFPRSEADAVLSLLSGSGKMSYGSRIAGVNLSAAESVSDKRAALKRTSVGFADASPSRLKALDQGTERSTSRNTKARVMDFGWVLEIGSENAPVQKSQFALISVPAWASQLTVTVRTGWLGADSEEISAEPYTYYVPIPPDYEAFDAFIGGEEAVRRPQINRELMDDVQLVACREARVLIPGLRLWRSAMVTLGAERADRITVLPNMGGILAWFSELAPTMKEGPAKLRVWTSEGVDMVTDKVTVSIPDGCGDAPAVVPPAPEVVAGSD